MRVAKASGSGSVRVETLGLDGRPAGCWRLGRPRPSFAGDGRLPDPRLTVPKGDHISLIGNTLADRMQHDGWLETYLHSRFPEHELTIRNLGFSGDELTIRLRSADFGTPDEWLSRNQDRRHLRLLRLQRVVRGEPGRSSRTTSTPSSSTRSPRSTTAKSPPRLVLFSPIAHEDLHDPILPDGKANNDRLERYTAAMAEVAEANDVPFVDLFHPTQELYADGRRAATINGIHLTAEGNRMLAEIIDQALFPDGPPLKRDAEALEKLRQAVARQELLLVQPLPHGRRLLDLRRPGRPEVRRRPDQPRGHAARDGSPRRDDRQPRQADLGRGRRASDLKVDDSNTPPFIPVKTNKPGAGPERRARLPRRRGGDRAR